MSTNLKSLYKAFIKIIASHITLAFHEVYLETKGQHHRMDGNMMQQIIEAWISKLNFAGFQSHFFQDILSRVEDTKKDESIEEEEEPEKDPFRGVILNSTSYRWLVTSLRQNLLLETAQYSPGNVQYQISHEINAHLGPVRVSRKRPQAPCEVFYHGN